MGGSIPNLKDLDRNTPGRVYLCRIDGQISCGACCGLYNIKDLSEEHLTTILTRRTQLFGITKRTESNLDEFADEIGRTESRYRPLESFHHCPFLGFPDIEVPSVGCLLHPLAHGNDGVDYRGLSYYGGYACRSYFCPTVHHLPVEHKKVLRSAAPNWYLYGLLITETPMLKHFFAVIESRLGKPITAGAVIRTSASLEAIRNLFYLKPSWPFREKGANTLVNYVFRNPSDEPPWQSIDYHKLDLKPSTWTPVFHALYSVFNSAEDVMIAEKQLEDLVDQILNSFSKRPS